jgi:threonine dehydrogenase-like Zn-dependent dehydrogenase
LRYPKNILSLFLGWKIETWVNDLQLAKRINLLDTVTHRFTLEQYEEAFETSMKDAGKVLFIHR